MADQDSPLERAWSASLAGGEVAVHRRGADPHPLGDLQQRRGFVAKPSEPVSGLAEQALTGGSNGSAGAVHPSVAPRGIALPRAKRAIEGTQLGVSEQERDLTQADVGIAQPSPSSRAIARMLG